MRVALIRIGNSKGVRLPKGVIERAGLGDEVEMEVRDGMVILSSTRPVRGGWEAAARACREAGEDEMGDWDAAIDEFE